MEFPINFKTIIEAHLVPSRSRTQVWKHLVPRFWSWTQPQPQKILLFKPKKKWKQWNTETRKLDLGPHFRDCISRTAVPRSRESGLHFKYHRSRITFLQLRKQDSDTGFRFQSRTQPQPQKILLFKPKKKMETMKHGNTETGSGTAFPKLYFRDCISRIAVPRSRESGLHLWDCISEITGPGLHFRDHGNGTLN